MRTLDDTNIKDFIETIITVNNVLAIELLIGFKIIRVIHQLPGLFIHDVLILVASYHLRNLGIRFEYQSLKYITCSRKSHVFVDTLRENILCELNNFLKLLFLNVDVI